MTARNAKQSGKEALGADLILPALALLFGVYYVSTIWNLVWEAKAAGFAVGGILLLLIAILAIKIARRLYAGDGTLGLGQIAAADSAQYQRLGLLAATILFVAVIPYLGFTLSVFLLMLVLMMILGVRSPLTLFGTAFCVAAGGYLLFVALVKTKLPHGPVERLLAGLF